jgi:acyl carrier protein
VTREVIQGGMLQALASVAPEVSGQVIDPDTPLRDQVDLDSMDFLNVMIALHGSLGVDVPETDYSQFTTLRGAVDYLVDRIGGRQ